MQIGIVGLPNSGKSTLFNALTRSSAAAVANYPFCTIDPNVGVVEVPDERIQKLAELVHPERLVKAIVEFVDIAGLVKGASQGEGLGNKFLSHIRQCDAIAQVVRFFADPNIIHVHGKVSPPDDVAVIHAELILADLQTIEKKLPEAEKKTKSGDKAALQQLALLKNIKAALESGKRAISLAYTDEEKEFLKDLHLLTNKPFVFIANVDENALAEFNHEEAKKMLQLGPGEDIVPICAKTEAELAAFSPEEAKNFLKELGLKESGLNLLIQTAYRLLGLHTYFTAGPKEVRAWTIPIGAKAPQAAGKIHSDFEKGFIKADVISYSDYIASCGEVKAREKGLLRQEGKEYVVNDGDVVVFKFNV